MTRIVIERFEHATLYFGDCLEVLPTLDMVDAVVTDPPYSSGGMLRGDRMQTTRQKYQTTGELEEVHPEFTGDNRDQRGFLAWASLWLMQAMAITAPAGMVVLFSDWRQLPTMTDAMQAGGWVWRGIVPWDKENSRPMPNRFRNQCEYVVWGTNGPRPFDMRDPTAVYLPGIVRGLAPKDREHSTQKPVSVMASLCDVVPKGGLILDAFMGSCSTGVAALQTGRRFIGIEKDARIFSRACRRMERACMQGTPELVEPKTSNSAIVSADLFGEEAPRT